MENITLSNRLLRKDLKEVNKESVKTDELILGYFNNLKKEISELPEVKYYDSDIKNVRSELRDEFKDELKSLQILIEEIKGKQEVLKEQINNRPIAPDPSQKQGNDPLTPTNQEFATLKDLAANYRLFVNRVEQQLYTIGGGGAGFIKDLDDVSFDTGIGTNKLLIYNGSQWVGIASTALTSSISVISGDLTVSGNLSVGGTITYDDVTYVDSIGIATARSGLEIGAGSITTIIKLDAATATTTTTSESNIDTFDASVFRSAQYQIQITRGSLYHLTSLNVLHDGTNVYLSEFGTVKSSDTSLATFDADINSGNVRVRGTPTSSDSTVFKISKVLTKV